MAAAAEDAGPGCGRLLCGAGLLTPDKLLALQANLHIRNGVHRFTLTSVQASHHFCPEPRSDRPPWTLGNLLMSQPAKQCLLSDRILLGSNSWMVLRVVEAFRKCSSTAANMLMPQSNSAGQCLVHMDSEAQHNAINLIKYHACGRLYMNQVSQDPDCSSKPTFLLHDETSNCNVNLQR